MSVYIKKGTPMHGPSLCDTCYRSHIYKGYRHSEQVVVCQATYPEMPVYFPVRECSSYSEQGRQTLRQMEDIAWTLVPRGPKRQAGFVAPADVKEGDREIELVLDDEA
jgi:hypothetical protein